MMRKRKGGKVYSSMYMCATDDVGTGSDVEELNPPLQEINA